MIGEQTSRAALSLVIGLDAARAKPALHALPLYRLNLVPDLQRPACRQETLGIDRRLAAAFLGLDGALFAQPGYEKASCRELNATRVEVI